MTISSIYRMGPSEHRSDGMDRVAQMKKRYLKNEGVLVVDVNDPSLNEYEQKFLASIGEKIHGVKPCLK